MRGSTRLEPAGAPDRNVGRRGPRPLDNAPVAMLSAAAAGAAGCSIQFMLMTGSLTGVGASIGTVIWSGLLVFAVVWVVAALVFLVGLLFVGLPVWMGLDRLGWMSPVLAPGAGTALSALAAGRFGGLPSAAFLLLPGAAAGWTLHRVAYAGRPS